MKEQLNTVTLQNILWPQAGLCAIEDMYFRAPKQGCVLTHGQVQMHAGAKVSSDTYFNGLSVDKWKKYTVAERFSVRLRLKGSLRVCLMCCELVNDEIVRRLVSEEIVETAEMEERVFSYPDKLKGMAYFTLEALSDGCVFSGGAYLSEVHEAALSEVKLGIAICTFRREEYIYNNLEILRSHLIENPDSELCGKLEVFVSDNGKTLDSGKEATDAIHIVQNKNAGGAAGFTRGMIEILRANEAGDHITHVILMDDDITIEPESIRKTWRILTILKAEYRDAFIGGAMLRNDKQNIQVESGAFWNAGRLIGLKANLDMSELEDCLYNEVEEAREYNAWWYCCIPMRVIREDNLPMPVFIRGDDVEYGLRNTKTLILMNGICVWHEPFDNKYSSFLSYYILRNQLIDNALHYPKYGARHLKKELYGSALREIMYFRYQNVDLLLRGVRDFLKGIDWLIASDGESLHREIMAAGYRAEPIEKLPVNFFYQQYVKSLTENDCGVHRFLRLMSGNGYLLPAWKKKTASMARVRPYNAFGAKEILYYDPSTNKGFICKRSFSEMLRCLKELCKINGEINRNYRKAKLGYRKRQKEVQNLAFWKKYLGLS